MPKEETRAVKRIPLYEEKTSGKTYVSAEVEPQEIGATLKRLQHQIWAKNGETIRVFDKSLVLHGETLLHAAKRIWQNEKPNDFNADDRFAMLTALQSAVIGRHGQMITDHVKFDAKASVPNWQMINLQPMKSNEYGTLLIWNQPKQATTTQETPPMSKTMYDSHIDSEQNATPIFMLEDNHLERIISGLAKRFVNLRAKMSEDIANTDPMVAAMGRTQKWSPEQLQTHTRAILNELNPYLQEALVRNDRSCMAAASEAMLLIAKRDKKVERPAELQLIAIDEEENF